MSVLLYVHSNNPMPCALHVVCNSQMTKMLDLLDSYLSQSGHNACRIDGSMSYQARQESIESFNNEPNSWVFLLSTRAGGLGINLTAADTVIIYDSDWNPHQDLQVRDKARSVAADEVGKHTEECASFCGMCFSVVLED